MSAYSPYSQTAIYNRGQQFEIAPSPSSYLLNSLPPRGQNSQFQQPFSYTPQAPSNGISYYQSQQQSQYQTPFQQYSQQPSMIQYVKPQSTILGQSNIANSYQLRDFPQQPIQSSNIIVQQQNYPTDPRTFQHPGYISNNTPLYQSTLSRNSQNDQDIQIQTYSPLQLSRNSAVIEGLVDQTLRNIKTGSTVQHEKRDQNYFFSGYIHISGQGTYKKYPLKSRNNNNNISVSQQESKQKQGTQSFSYDGPVPSQQFMGNLIEIARAEENIERIKSRLVEQQDYNLPAFFKQFDKNQSGKISLSEFIQGQKDFGSTLSQPQAALIFSRVLSNSQALLFYEDFRSLFLPKLNSSIQRSVTQQNVQEVNISQKTIELFRQLLNSLSQSEQLIDSLRKRLSRTSTNVLPFFGELNIERNNSLTISEMETGLKKYNDGITQAQVSLLFYRVCDRQITKMSPNDFELFCFGGQKNNNSSIVQRSQANQQIFYPHDEVSQSLLRSQYPSALRITDFSEVLTKFAHNSKLESDIENLQKQLAQRNDFNLNILFSFFKPRKSNVDGYQFSESLKNIFGIPLVDISDVILLFRKVQGGYKNVNRKLDEINFTEFCNLLVAQGQRLPQSVYEQKEDINVSPDTIQLISKIFKVHLNNEVLFNQIRLYISTNEVSILGIFNTLCNNKKYVDQNDFDMALKANGSTCPPQYHDLTFQRFDPKGLGTFDFTFFTNALKI